MMSADAVNAERSLRETGRKGYTEGTAENERIK